MKKSTVFALLVLGIGAFSFGSRGETEDGDIPFRMLGHLMMVQATINDSPEAFNFVVDTGGATFVSKEVADGLGLKQLGQQAKIDTLRLPGFQIEKIFCFTTFDFSHFNSLSVPVHGIIGSTLLERFRVTFDFTDRIMTLSEDSPESPNNGLRMKFRNHPVNNAPLIEIKINGKTLEAMIDTGQPNPVVLPIDTFHEYTPEDFAGLFKSRGLMEKWPTTKVDFNYQARLKTVELGNMAFGNVPCLFGDLPRPLSMPLLGTDLLSQFRIIIDFPGDEMWMIPNHDFRLQDNLFSVGLNVALNEESDVFVTGLWENSPADKAGIRVGDHILSFRSQAVRPDNLLELQNALRDDAVETIELEVVSQGEKKRVLLEKRLLF